MAPSDSRPQAPESPRIAGLNPIFRHLDDADVPWQAVKSQRNADGTESHVWEKWLAFSPDPQYLTIYAKYDQGMIVRRHGHFSSHIVFMLEGDATFGDHHCPTETHIELPLGAAFGPVIAGPQGALMFEVMMGDPRSWGDQPDLFEAALRERGVVALPGTVLVGAALLALGLLAVEIAVKITEAAEATGKTNFTPYVGAVMLAVALVFVWRSFYAMRIPQREGGLS